MALATNFKPVQGLTVVTGTEATVGSGTLLSGANWIRSPILAIPTIHERQVALDVGSQQTGTYTPRSSQMKQRLDNGMWEIELQILGLTFATNALNVVGLKDLFNSNTCPITLLGNYTPPDWTHGATNVLAEHASTAIYIGGAGHRETPNRDYLYKGCICTGISLSHGIDSNGGFPIVTATYVTGFQRTEVDAIADGTIEAVPWGDHTNNTAVHWTTASSSTGRVGLTSSADYEVRAYGYNISASRDIQRIGYKDTTDYEPFSYEQVGGFTVTGDVTFKKDINLSSIEAYFRNDTVGGFKFSDGSAYTVEFSGIVSGVSNDTGSPELRNTISFQGSAVAGADAIISIDL